MRWAPARGAAALLCAVTAVVVLAGCSFSLGNSAPDGSQINYIAGSGTWTWNAPGKRASPVHLVGRAADGAKVDVADWRGDIVVVNVWFAGCSPCRAEAPTLARAAESAGPHVHFLGINTDDSRSVVQAFQRRYAVPYPSILDADSGAAVLSLRGSLPPSATPSTIILDTRGRPAARIVGPADPSVLTWLIQDVRAGTLTPRQTASTPAPTSSSVPSSSAPSASGASTSGAP